MSDEMCSAFSVVDAGPDEVDFVAPLFDAYRVFYGQRSNIEAAASFIHERLSRGESVIYVAFGAGGEARVPLGFVQLYPSFSSVSLKRLWILNDLFVAPAARQRGVGRALLERARRLAKDTGAKGLILETATTNRAAQALYRSDGWVRDTEFYRYAVLV